MSNVVHLENVDDVQKKKYEYIKMAKARYYQKKNKILNLSKEIVKELKSIMNKKMTLNTENY